MTIKIIEKVLVMDAVYWGVPTNDGFGGYTTVAPVALKVRWDDLTEQFIDTEGRETVSNAKVMSGVDLEPGGFLKLALLADLGTNLDPQNNSDVYEIRKFEKIPTILADQFVRISTL